MAGLRRSAPAFEETLRRQIAAEVEASFVGLARKTVESFLGLEAGSSELDKLAGEFKWTVDGATVRFPRNESNSPASTVQREKIEIEQLGRLLAATPAELLAATQK